MALLTLWFEEATISGLSSGIIGWRLIEWPTPLGRIRVGDAGVAPAISELTELVFAASPVVPLPFWLDCYYC